MSDITDDLDALINLPGYQRFHAHVVEEWGPAGKRFQQSVFAAADSPDATAKLREVIFAQQEIGKLMAWPQEVLSRAKADAVGPAPGSRRGIGL